MNQLNINETDFKKIKLECVYEIIEITKENGNFYMDSSFLSKKVSVNLLPFISVGWGLHAIVHDSCDSVYRHLEAGDSYFSSKIIGLEVV